MLVRLSPLRASAAMPHQFDSAVQAMVAAGMQFATAA
jgi:hypothetical protein